MRACQRECSGIVIKGDIAPARRDVADGTACTELPIMAIIPGVTGKTIFGSAFENSILMTGQAIHAPMFANQRKCRGIVIEFSACPGCGLVTGGAVPAKLTPVDIFCGVTGKAITGCIFVYSVDMAGFTFRIHV
jgi:hypothetical protein